MRRLAFATVLVAAIALAQTPSPDNVASVGGRVTDASGQPVRKAGITLRAQSGGGPRVFSTSTDADGRYSFTLVPPGGYTLIAEHPGYLSKMYRVTPKEVFSTLTLSAGVRLQNLDLVMARAATLSGRVLDADGDAIAGVPVHLLRHNLQSGSALMLQQTATTDASGQYQFAGLTPGRYYLSAGTDGPALSVLGLQAAPGRILEPTTAREDARVFYAATFYPAAASAQAAQAIEVQHDDRSGLDIRLRKTRAFRVKGRLAGNAGSAMVMLAPADPPVVAMSPNEQGAVARLANDGPFDFAGWYFLPGDYWLVASGGGMPRATLARRRLTITDHDIDDAVLTIEPPVSLNGAVSIDGDPGADFSKLPGTPPPSLTMQISLLAGDRPSVSDIRSRIQNDGSFALAGIAPGTYTVRASGLPAGTWLKSVQLSVGASPDGRIEISSATASSPLRLSLSRSVGQIEGEVVSAQGLPSGGAVSFLKEGNSLTGMTGVGDNGRFTLTGLAPGSYRLYAWEDLEMAQRYDPDLLEAYRSQSVPVALSENGDAHVTLRLIPAPREP